MIEASTKLRKQRTRGWRAYHLFLPLSRLLWGFDWLSLAMLAVIYSRDTMRASSSKCQMIDESNEWASPTYQRPSVIQLQHNRSKISRSWKSLATANFRTASFFPSGRLSGWRCASGNYSSEHLLHWCLALLSSDSSK